MSATGLRLAIATCAQYPLLYAEERELLTHFTALGVTAVPAVWNDPKVDWAHFDAVVLRSTWDYVTEYEAFLDWLTQVETLRVPMINPTELVRWNLDKSYLASLARAGVRIVPTAFVEKGGFPDLARLLASRGWSRAVLKPTVSAGARDTHRFEATNVVDAQSALGEITTRSGALIQPYLAEIETAGELSLIFLGGEFAYAVVKRPKAGDYRVQFTHGGTFERVEPPAGVLNDARACLDALPTESAYARVDGVVLKEGFHLMEVELVEPYLHLPAAPEMASRFAKSIVNFI